MNPGRLQELLSFDRAHATGRRLRLAGIDEAGRGPLAGPVVAAAVLFLRPFSSPWLNDSKKLSPIRRKELFLEIARSAVVGVGVVDETTIDEINIFQATRLAMKRALMDLQVTPECVLIDGNQAIEIPIRQKTVVKGDQKSASIAAASIIAKVHRDAWMTHLDELYPGYEFGRHKGYGTRIHLEKLKDLGPSPVHRRSFAPVSEWTEVAGLSREVSR